MTRLTPLLSACALTLVASPAHAAINGFDLKLGLRGGPSVSTLFKPEDANDYKTVPYPDLAYGIGWHLGASLNMRVLDVIGVEVAGIYASESFEGSTTMVGFTIPGASESESEVKFKQTFSQKAVHIPMVLQLNIPVGMSRPFFSFGYDLVALRQNREYQTDFPGYTQPTDPNDAWAHAALPQTAIHSKLNEDDLAMYGGLIGGVGVNIVSGKTEIPLELRVVYYPGTGCKMSQVLGDPVGSGVGRCDTARPQAEASCANINAPELAPVVYYNDRPDLMFFVSMGFDYVAL